MKILNIVFLSTMLLSSFYLSWHSTTGIGATNESPADPHSALPNIVNGCPATADSVTFVKGLKEFTSLARGNSYLFANDGEQVEGKICRRILVFTDESGESIFVVVRPTQPLTIYQINYSAAIDKNDVTPTWAGYQYQNCANDFLGHCWYTGNVAYALMQQVPAQTIGNPSPAVNPTGCCIVSVWTGLGDVPEATDGLLAQAGFTSTNNYLGNHLFLWYETLPSLAVPVPTSACLPFAYGDTADVEVDWPGGSNYNFDFFTSRGTCEDTFHVTYPMTPTWGYLIGEDPLITTNCSFSYDSINNICQLPSWSSAYSITGQMAAPDMKWRGFNTGGNPVTATQMYQGCQDNAIPSSISNGNLFYLPYSTSKQVGFNC
jgi:hypothetical protein